MLTFLFLNQTYGVTTHWNRLGDTISLRVTSKGLVEKWESYHENSFVHSFLTVAMRQWQFFMCILICIQQG